MAFTFDPNEILALFRVLIKEFSGKIDSEILDVINLANQIAKMEDFKKQFDYNLALVYLSADIISFSTTSSSSPQSQSPGGSIIEKSIGDITIKYSSQTLASTTSTPSGSKFLDKYIELLRENGSIFLIVSQ